MSEISSTSYTNRDFSTIYTELLELTKQLTSKWDPSISNESDPGVVLVKLNALISDKCNYNIDKNILECFPTTVMQSENARKIYEMLGYYMKWYQSAVAAIGIGWTDLDTVNNSSSVLTIPAFTSVSNDDRSVVYSIIGPYNSSKLSVSDISIPMNGAQIAVTVMEGVAVKYSNGDSTTITQTDLDDDNRIYFSTVDIAQNGIFIHNINNNNYDDWEYKDNLATEPLLQTYYHFGVDNGKCYIEFPQDFSTVAGEGVEIIYFRTSGSNGNMPVNTITGFYEDLSVTIDDETLVLSQDNMSISNVTAGEGGADPESIKTAFKNYKKTVGTYNTLITLRDYFNAIVTSGYASNAIVSDRSCDQQNSYKIMASSNGVNTITTHIDTDEDDEVLMKAYDLKIYATAYIDPNSINTDVRYNYSFSPISDNTQIKSYLNDLKSISHDYLDISTPWLDESSNSTVPPYRSNIVMLKNMYSISASISTTQNISTTEATSIKNNINTYLYKNLNAASIEFGEPVYSSTLEYLIANSDARISGANISSITNAMYAVYYNGESFIEVPFDRATDSSGNITDDFIYDTHDNTNLEVLTAASTFLTTVGNTSKYWGKYDFSYSYSTAKWFLKYTMGDEEHALTDVTSTISNYLSGVSSLSLSDDAQFTIEVNPIEHIKDEIYVKSILAGNTPIVENDNKVTYSLADKKKYSTGLIENVLKMKASTSITIPASGYTQLQENDNLTFYCPSLVDLDSFSNYVRYAFVSTSRTSIVSNTNTQLSSNEYLFLFWKDDDSYSSIYQYKVYGSGSIIYSNFNFDRTSTTIPTYLNDAVSHASTSSGVFYGDSTTYELSSTESASVQSSSFEYMSGTKSLTVRKINNTTINDSYNLYWVLNSVDASGMYTLFTENQTTRTLKTGEYFFYTSGVTSTLNILGPGTKITRNNVDLSKWSVVPEDIDIINEYGSSALIDSWMTMVDGSSVVAEEQRYINLGSKCYIKIEGLSNPITVASGTPVQISSSCVIKYLLSTDDPTSTSASWNVLEQFDISTINWSVDSSVSLSIGDNVVQKLYSGQTLYVYTDENNYTTISGQNETSTYSALSLQSSEDIIITSANDIVYVYSVDSSNQTVYPTLWVYTSKKNFDITSGSSTVGKVIYNSTTSASIVYNAGTADVTATLPVELPSGEYLIELQHECDDVTSLTVTALINGTLTNITTYNSNISQFKNKNTYYLYVDATNPITNINVIYSGNRTTTKVVTLKSPIKITRPSGLSTTDWTKYKNLIRYVFDTSSLYNYMYQIPDDNLLSEPLSASNIFDPHHAFNSVSIAQLNTGNITYKMYWRG